MLQYAPGAGTQVPKQQENSLRNCTERTGDQCAGKTTFQYVPCTLLLRAQLSVRAACFKRCTQKWIGCRSTKSPIHLHAFPECGDETRWRRSDPGGMISCGVITRGFRTNVNEPFRLVRVNFNAMRQCKIRQTPVDY